MRSPALAVGLTLVVAQLAVGAQSLIGRESDRHPDLTGYWTNDSFTPLERSSELGNKEFFTPEEAASYFQAAPRSSERAVEGRHPLRRCAVAGGNYDEGSRTCGRRWCSTRRTGGCRRLPRRRSAVTPRGETRPPAADPRTAHKAGSLGERCISWGNVGPPMLPPTYNANFQILETPRGGDRAARDGARHADRFIWMAGRTVAAGVRLLAGDSARPVGRRHARHRHDELHGRDELQRVAADDATGYLRERRASCRRAPHLARCGHNPVSIHRRGPEDVDPLLVRRDSTSIAGRVQSTSTRATRAITGLPTSCGPPARPSRNAPRTPQRVDKGANAFSKFLPARSARRREQRLVVGAELLNRLSGQLWCVSRRTRRYPEHRW